MKPSARITQHIDSFSDWRGKALGRIRRLITEAGPDLSEDWKWNTPVWTFGGNVLALGAFQDHIKVNFFEGAFKGLVISAVERKRAKAKPKPRRK